MPHYDVCETGTGIRNIQEGKTLHIVETKSRGFRDEMCWTVEGMFRKERDGYGRNGLEGRTRKGFV